MKDGKAAVVSGIAAEMLKSSGEDMEHGNFRVQSTGREAVNIDEMQFMSGKGNMDAISITGQMQERFLAKKRRKICTLPLLI